MIYLIFTITKHPSQCVKHICESTHTCRHKTCFINSTPTIKSPLFIFYCIIFQGINQPIIFKNHSGPRVAYRTRHIFTITSSGVNLALIQSSSSDLIHFDLKMISLRRRKCAAVELHLIYSTNNVKMSLRLVCTRGQRIV